MTVIVADAFLVVSRMDVAVREMVGLAGTAEGAVYLTEVVVFPDSAPHAGTQLLPAWVSAHVTPWFPESFATLAANCCALDTFNETLVGDSMTDTGAVIVIVALAVLVLFETDVAVNLTVARLGTLLGAVYAMALPDALELAESDPQPLPLQPEPDSVHRTPRFLLSLRTVAMNCCLPVPACVLAEVGDTLTLIGAPLTTDGNTPIADSMAMATGNPRR